MLAPPKDKRKDDTSETDERDRDYYYDDAHGYQDYIDEDECDEKDEEESNNN